MKMNKKIYLLMEATGSWDNYRNVPTEAFSSRELAEKVSNGLQDTMQFLYDTKYKEEIKKADEEEYIFWGLDSEIQRTDEERETFYKQWNEKYAIYDSIRWYGIPIYSVQEIDLIS